MAAKKQWYQESTGCIVSPPAHLFSVKKLICSVLLKDIIRKNHIDKNHIDLSNVSQFMIRDKFNVAANYTHGYRDLVLSSKPA